MIADPNPAMSTILPAMFLQRHLVFVRRAREASQQAFFFLSLLEKPLGKQAQRAVAEYRPFALYQVRTLIRSVHVPDHYEVVERDLASGALAVMAETQQDFAQAIHLYRRWCNVFHHLTNTHTVDLEALRQDLTAFLADSEEQTFLKRLEVHWLPDLLGYLRKNLTLLWAITLVLGVTLKVEAIHSLLLNEGRALLYPLLLLLVPLFMGRLLPGLVRSLYGACPTWDLGGPALRSLRRQAVEPARLIVRWPIDDRGLPREIFKAQMAKLGAFAAWWAASFACLYGFHSFGRIDGSTLTAFLVLSHFYALLILARAVDYWEFLDPRSIRFLLLLGGMALLLAMLTGVAREVIILILLVAATVYALISRSRKRSTRRWVIAFLILAAAANVIGRQTLRSEVWRERPQERWDRLGRQEWPWPGSRSPVVLLAASGGGSRAAVYSGLVLHQLQADRPQIAEQLQAISSVSGGSLASAAYIVRLFDGHPEVADLNKALQEDFLLPTLFGALTPGQTRGSAIEQEWRDGPVGLHDHTLGDLARSWRQSIKASAVPPFPMPLFNSSTLDGHDVVISPLSKALYTRPGLDDEASDLKTNLYETEATRDGDAPTWVYYRDGTYSLEDLLADFNPLLSSAVRASANFPFGFPLVRLETKRPLFFSPLAADRLPDRKKLVRLTDGGALSNSGMWSLFNLLMNPDNLQQLRERGVLLIVVDASRMPSYRQLGRAVNSLWGTIEDQGPVGQRLHREMLELLERTYGSRIAVVQLDLVPRESFNVFTTWALDRGSLGRLKHSFDERWESELPNLDLSWSRLLAPPARGAWPPMEKAAYMSRSRPPLD